MKGEGSKAHSEKSKAGKTVFRPVFTAGLREAEDWLDIMAQRGFVPERLVCGCLWRFAAAEAPAWDRYQYIDIKANAQGLFGQEKLAELLPRLRTVFDCEETRAVLTNKRPCALTVKPNPNYRLEQFAVQERKYRYKGARIVQHMTPDIMLETVKNKRAAALLARSRTAFIAWLVAFVLVCCLLVWYKGLGFHLLFTLPLWTGMLYWLISFLRLSADVKKTEPKKKKGRDKTD